MVTPRINPNQFEGFYWSGHPSLPSRLGAFMMAGDDGWHGELDADNCMIKGPDSWEGMSRIMAGRPNKAFIEEDTRINKIYGSRHDVMGPEEAEEWWLSTLNNQVKTDPAISRNEINDVGRTLQPREGLLEYADFAAEHGIPNVVISAGIEDIIAAFLDEHRIHYEELLANKFIYESDLVTGYVRLVHFYNKLQESQYNPIIRALRAERPFALIIGDGLRDAQLRNGNEQRSVAFRTSIPPNLEGEELKAFLEQSYEEGYDAVPRDGTFHPIVPTLRALACGEVKVD